MSHQKFWSSQPVPKLGSCRFSPTCPPSPALRLTRLLCPSRAVTNITPDGPIEKDKPSEEIKQEPYPLPKDFEWVTMDLGDPVQVRQNVRHCFISVQNADDSRCTRDIQLKEVYELLTHNYVEDEQATFRFDYHAEFIRW